MTVWHRQHLVRNPCRRKTWHNRQMPTLRSFSIDERRERLATRHRLATEHRTNDVVAIADSLVGLHSSDPATVYLSVVARMRTPRLEVLSTALYEDRSVVRHHAMRRTMFVFSLDTARIAHGACTAALAAKEHNALARLIESNGIDADGDRWIRQSKAATLEALSRRGGQATAKQLGNDVPALRAPLLFGEGKKWEGTIAAHTRVLLVLGFEGVLVRGRPVGSWISSQYHWASMSDWLPDGVTGIEAGTAAPALVARYLAAFGPATTKDVQWWTGWTVGATRTALAAAGATQVLVHGDEAWALADDLDVTVARDEPWVALLPGLDPTTMGWKQRDWYLQPGHAAALFDRNGNAGPTIWADGRVVGAWAQRKSGEIALRLLDDVGSETSAAVEQAAHDLQRLLGDTRISVRFPAPILAELLG